MSANKLPDLVHELSDLVHVLSELIHVLSDLVHELSKLIHVLSDLVHEQEEPAPNPAARPLAQAHWKLKPPMRPSTSRISPQR